MSDIDFAFNNYCIACDKLCPANSIYCSETCKATDEYQSSSVIDQVNQDNHHHHHEHESHSHELVSPLLTPSLYQHNNYSINGALNSTNHDLNDYSPLLLSAKYDTNDVHHFDLNYSISSSTNANNTITDHLPSTSHNYRKWLTACL